MANCPSCWNDNPPGATACARCGTQLQQGAGQPPASGYGQPPGAPPDAGGYGAPPGAPPQLGFGQPPGAPPQDGYGAPPGAPPQAGGYGAPPGAPPQAGGYGAPPGAPPQHDYGAPPQGGYGQPPGAPPGASAQFGFSTPNAAQGQTVGPMGAGGDPGESDPERLTKLGGIPGKYAGAFCYFPFCACLSPIAAAVVLAAEDKASRFARFHAIQALALWVGVIVYQVVGFLGQIVMAIMIRALPHDFRQVVALLFTGVLGLFGMVILGALGAGTIMAAMGRAFRLPLIGDFAAKQAGL
jgi:uncharacterized membrane protein